MRYTGTMREVKNGNFRINNCNNFRLLFQTSSLLTHLDGPVRTSINNICPEQKKKEVMYTLHIPVLLYKSSI